MKLLAKFRSLLFLIVMVPLSMVYGTFTLFLRLTPVLTRHKLTIGWCHIALFVLRWTCGVRYEIEGKENYQRANGPIVILSKHQSTWETFILQILFFPACTLLKKELLKIPFFGWGLAGLQPIAIDRSNPREAIKQVKAKGIESIKKNLNMIMFPEGTRTKPGERLKYARSGADIAINSGVKIIPVAMNSGYCWPGKTLTMYPGLISVKIGEPIATDGRTSRDVTEEVEQWIEGKMITLTKPEDLQKDNDNQA